MSAKFIINNVQGKTWPVELDETDGRVFVTTGWPKFVEDNCLVEGEFLVFKSYGDMQLMVLIFGVNAVEKSVWSSESGARAIGNLEGKPPCHSSMKEHVGDELTEMVPQSLSHSHSQVRYQISRRRSISLVHACGNKHTIQYSSFWSLYYVYFII